MIAQDNIDYGVRFKNTAVAYGSVSKFFHWLIFVLLLFMLTLGYFLHDIPKAYQSLVYNTHKLTGLSILIFMILRVIWALSNPKPRLPKETRPWEGVAERSVHFLLYVSVISMPLAGWIGSSAAGRPPHIGDFHMMLPVAQSKTLSEMAFRVHGLLALTIIALVCVHVLAALYHHFIRHDDVLRRMMPKN